MLHGSLHSVSYLKIADSYIVS